jgi:hypothetical protein
MKEVVCSKELKPFLKKELRNNSIRFKERNEKLLVSETVSNTKLKKPILYARCSLQESMYMFPRGVLPYDDWVNDKKRKEKQRKFNGAAVALLRRDVQ